MIHHLTVPISDEAISALTVGDQVTVTGVIFTARDAAHKYMVEKFVKTGGQPPESEQALYDLLKEKLDGGVIYHCGPVVAKENGHWQFVAAGPTTSIREEVYQDLVIEHFNVKAVIGKGGMGPRTLGGLPEAEGGLSARRRRRRHVDRRDGEGSGGRPQAQGVWDARGLLADPRRGVPRRRHHGQPRHVDPRQGGGGVGGEV